MKPRYEHVAFAAGTSLRVYHRRIARIPFEWHHHPEFELTLTLNSRGWRFVGDSRMQYASPDLVLIPPDMPHTWASDATPNRKHPQTAVVLWFSERWAYRVAELMPEYAAIRRLLKQSASGLLFAPAGQALVRRQLRRLLSPDPRLRLHGALQALVELSACDAVPLAQPSPVRSQSGSGAPDNVLGLLHKRFRQPLRIAQICRACHLSPRALHRQMAQHTGQSVMDYLNRLRVSHACMQLAESDAPIALIASESGFQNLANFNRRFRAVQQTTPSQFRKQHRAVGLPEPEPGNLHERPPSLVRMPPIMKKRKDSSVS